MPWNIDYLHAEGVIRAKTQGKIGIDELKSLIATLVEEGSRRRTAKFLVDHRDMIPTVSLTDLYHLASEQEKLGASRQQSVAILWRPSREQNRVMEFYQDRAHNTGYNHRLFTTEPEALAWLAQIGVDGAEDGQHRLDLPTPRCPSASR